MSKQKLGVLAGVIVVIAAASVWAVLRIRQQNDPIARDAALAAELQGKNPVEVTKWIFDNQGCADCHGFTQMGAFGLNSKGQDLMEGFEGCPAMMEEVQQTLTIPDAQWTERHKKIRGDFVSFGCGACHRIGTTSVGVTKMGELATDLLHKGCLSMCCPPQNTSPAGQAN
ncbi:MAG: hypothetical protein HY315_05180 [Acidobacteria bacterium]|nr:hypothetical protein [Acidobacteriota bacterium]